MNKISLSINEISNIFSKTTELSFLMSSIWYNRKTIWHWKLWSRSILRYTYLTNFHQIEGVEWLEKNTAINTFLTLCTKVYINVYIDTHTLYVHIRGIYIRFSKQNVIYLFKRAKQKHYMEGLLLLTLCISVRKVSNQISRNSFQGTRSNVYWTYLFDRIYLAADSILITILITLNILLIDDLTLIFFSFLTFISYASDTARLIVTSDFIKTQSPFPFDEHDTRRGNDLGTRLSSGFNNY